MKRHHATIAALALVAAALGGCNETVPAPAPARPVGADRDAHGCIGSAGYRWCEKEKACVRPWELAEQRDFDNTPEAFSGYCDSK